MWYHLKSWICAQSLCFNNCENPVLHEIRYKSRACGNKNTLPAVLKVYSEKFQFGFSLATSSSYKTKITPLSVYKKLNLKLDDKLELGKIIHNFHSGNLPDNFNRLIKFSPMWFKYTVVQRGVRIFGKRPITNMKKGFWNI